MDAGGRTTRTTGGTARPSEAERRLERLLDALAASRGVPHAVLAVEATDGSFRWAGARGDARPGGPPMRVDTPYYIASIDKMFTAVAVLQLAERGRLRLDEPIAAYLPGALTSGLHRLDGRDRSDEITVRHLLSHTSGRASYLEDAPKGGRRRGGRAAPGRPSPRDPARAALVGRDPRHGRRSAAVHEGPGAGRAVRGSRVARAHARSVAPLRPPPRRGRRARAELADRVRPGRCRTASSLASCGR